VQNLVPSHIGLSCVNDLFHNYYKSFMYQLVLIIYFLSTSNLLNIFRNVLHLLKS